MTPPARVEAAIELLTEIMAAPGIAADQIVAAWFRRRRYAGAKDRRWITEITWTVLRRRGELQWATGSWPATPQARSLVLAALALQADAEALFGSDPHGPAPLTDAELSLIRKGPASFASAPDWARGNYPAGLDPELRESLGTRLVAEMEAFTERSPLDLRVNTLKATRTEAQAALAGEGIETEATPLSPIGLRVSGRANVSETVAFRDGLVEVQDEGSQIAALMVGAMPGETVMDYCAGGGGKALTLAAAMANRGRVIATDTHPGRLQAARERVQRAGAGIVELRGDPATLSDPADRVLVDAPCTGSGTWRRNPATKWTTTPADIAAKAAEQTAILEQAARLVRPGGRLVYATCSLFAAENGAQVGRFLGAHSAFQEVAPKQAWREAGLPGEAPPAPVGVQLTPLRHRTDGFFVAVLERVG